ncbi:hypothetical protein FRC00_011207 [Tulasnella sp. 408]|nr:hypothetical protein FRC00_011207 [Tulasnella sp. 408]
MEYMAVFGKAGVQNVDAVKQKEKEIEEIEAQIKKEVEASRTSSERNEHLRQTTIYVVLSSETELKAAELRITYVVNGASWTPAYEIRATTDTNGQLNKTVALHYKAAITQNTGEDWKNTKLTLNTTSPALARVILPHSGLKIRPGAAANGQNGGFPDRLNKAGPNAQQLALLQMRQQQAQMQQHQAQMQQQQPQLQQLQAQPRAGALFGNAGGNTFGSSNAGAGGPFGSTTTGASAFGAPQSQQPQQQTQQPAPAFGAFSQSAPSAPGFGFGSASVGSSAFGGAVAASDEVPLPALAADSNPSAAAAVNPGTMADAAFNYAGAVSESTAVSATYKIEGKNTILSGIATHKVVISTSTVLPVEVYVVTMPRVQPWATLQAKIKNTSAEPLLAGLASIFNDDSYVSSTQLPLVSPGDSFICSFGMDNKVKVSFAHKDGSVVINNIPFAGNTESVLATNTIKVKNNRNVPISRLIIRDAVPAGQDPVKVLLKTPAELATVASAEETVKIAEGGIARWSKEKTNSREEGLIEWVLENVQSGEEKKVELAWSVEVPQGFKWSYGF